MLFPYVDKHQSFFPPLLPEKGGDSRALIRQRGSRLLPLAIPVLFYISRYLTLAIQHGF